MNDATTVWVHVSKSDGRTLHLGSVARSKAASDYWAAQDRFHIVGATKARRATLTLSSPKQKKANKR